MESQLEEPWLRDYKDNKLFLIDGLLYHREKHTGSLTVIDRLQEFHDFPYMGQMSEDRTRERVASIAWWPKWEQELSEYIKTCERFQKGKPKAWEEIWATSAHRRTQKPMGNHQHGLGHRTSSRRKRKLQ
ncbi:hypothetical protein O181_000725 [Austropuccinia psidii MF-1]|uniref:Integrase zinc-binding domain-containing protein n=1 Tax=Austropuccinia psidii MF-1 TaxID=1389203 RepID=A0A9Q3B9K3_9BASI|nr:hypothetical protein [Austropuccinia psidii MF-1]